MRNFKKCIWVDIDGTIANTDHRQHHMQKNPKKNYKAFHDAMHLDEPHSEILWLIQTLYMDGNQIVIATGREEKFKERTVEWLTKHNVPYDALYMCRDGDNRSDAITKLELLEHMQKDGYDPYIFLEDRQRVVDALRVIGKKVLQVAPGDF
jgi:uncharacterized HAD superfamily protein